MCNIDRFSTSPGRKYTSPDESGVLDVTCEPKDCINPEYQEFLRDTCKNDPQGQKPSFLEFLESDLPVSLKNAEPMCDRPNSLRALPVLPVTSKYPDVKELFEFNLWASDVETY